MLLTLAVGCSSSTEPPPLTGVFASHQWAIDQLVASGKREPLTDGGVTDQPVDVRFRRGFVALAPPGESTEAFGEVHATADGKTYWVDAVAPQPDSLRNPESPIEVRSTLTEVHGFIKRDPAATLKMTITALTLEAIDTNVFDPDALECGSATATNCTWVTNAEVTGEVYAGTQREKLDEFQFDALLRGWRNHWQFAAFATDEFIDPDGHPTQRDRPDVLDHQRFDFDKDVNRNLGSFARAKLQQSDTIEIPLDRVQVGELFVIQMEVTSAAQNRREGETFVSAHFRDPLEPQGASFDVSGLEPVPVPDNFPRFPRAAPVAAPPCPAASDPEAGTLQFGEAEILTPEGLQRFALVPVTRAGGSRGVVSASLSSTDGSAIAGTDYQPLSTIVRFEDGVGGTQFLKLSVLDNDLIDGDRTVLLRLSSPMGCAGLGVPAEATLTILDNDQPLAPPPTFTIGGTVSGLSGVGLVLRDALAPETLVVASNGVFTFATPRLDATSYDVRVDAQPTNPLQGCTVANGSGAVAGANVTSITVTCTTPAPPGTLDPSFGDSGRAVTGVAYTPNLLGARIGMALQGDGKILLVGGLKLLRLKTDGTLDTTFGTAGVVDVVFNGAALDTAMDVAVQADGRIVVAGTTSTLVVGSDDFALTRFDSDGRLDTTFGTAGHVTTDFFGSTDQVRRMRIQGDGKILVIGSAVHLVSPSSGSTLFAIARYDGDGTPDLTFASGGKATDSPGQTFSIANGLTIQDDGKIVVAGSTAASGGDDADTGFVRYLGDGQVRPPGTRDDTFGPMSNGTLEASIGADDQAVDVVTLVDGTILGAVRVNSGVTSGSFGFGLAHVPASGVPAPRLPQPIITFTTQSDFPRSMLKQADGKIVVVGQSGGFGTNPDMAIARFDDSGFAPDASFGTDGKLTVDFFGAIDGAEAVAQQPDGKLVVGGFARSGAASVFAAVRVAQ